MKLATQHLATLIALVATSGLAVAQVDSPPKSSTTSATPETQHAQHATQTAKSDMPSMSGMHDMPATVTGVDHKTGIVEVDSANMKLKVHFPPDTITDLKKGDKISLHLSYSKQ